jgi:hypothetical protein
VILLAEIRGNAKIKHFFKNISCYLHSKKSIKHKFQYVYRTLRNTLLSGQYFKTTFRYSSTIAAAADSAKPPQNFSHVQKFLHLFRLIHILFQLLWQKLAMNTRNMKNLHFLYV